MTDSDSPMQPENTTPAQPAVPETEAAPLIPVPPVAPATPAAGPQTQTRRVGRDGKYCWGVGRRKSSVARVRITPGEGVVKINKKDLNDYFSLHQDREAAVAPLTATDARRKYDVFINVRGGGTTGQSGAIKMGLARALVIADSQFETTLRDRGYMTRDSRIVERKKPGRRKARRRFQFSKR